MAECLRENVDTILNSIAQLVATPEELERAMAHTSNWGDDDKPQMFKKHIRWLFSNEPEIHSRIGLFINKLGIMASGISDACKAE